MRWLLLACTAAAFIIPAASATAAVTASADSTTIVITGTTEADITTLTDEGDNVRITNAVRGSGCEQSGGDVLCPRSGRTIGADLSSGNDQFDNLSALQVSVVGGAGDDVLQGGAEKDRIVPGPGTDTVGGRGGSDILDYSSSPVAIHAHLDTSGGREVREFAATATKDTLLDDFEILLGSPLNDVLRGSSGSNDIRGNGGSDVIDGRAGNDFLDGGIGNDRFGTVSATVAETVPAAQVTVGNAASGDGKDTVKGGAGNDDLNVRDVFLDAQVDCGTGSDFAREDLVDFDQNLDVVNCETLETAAVDQLMTVVVRLRRTRRKLKVLLRCPTASKVACKGKAGRAARSGGRLRGVARYRIAKGRQKTVTVSGSGRFLVLVERDQRRRVRRLVRKLGRAHSAASRCQQHSARRSARCRYARQGALSRRDSGLSRVPHCDSAATEFRPGAALPWWSEEQWILRRY